MKTLHKAECTCCNSAMILWADTVEGRFDCGIETPCPNHPIIHMPDDAIKGVLKERHDAGQPK